MNLQAIIQKTKESKGTYTEFKQSRLPFKLIDPSLKGGCCLALCILLLARRFDGVLAAYDKSIDEIEKGEGSAHQEIATIMNRQRQIKRPDESPRFAEDTLPEYLAWMEELARKYGLQLDRHKYEPKDVLAGEIAAYIKEKQARYVIGLVGNDGGHAISAANVGKTINFFDPNCGVFTLSSDVFTDWFLDFLDYSEYQVKYARFWNAVAFVA